MRHLWKNLKKFYKGSLFSQNMWAAAKSFTSDKYDYHMSKIEEKSPDVLDWLDDNHPHIWSRSKFSEECKVDYTNNNLSESFNSSVSKTKYVHIVQKLDHIRHMIIKKFEIRRKIGRKMVGRIIPHITRTLNEQSKKYEGS
jgi:transposase-like protein